ncbi:hypothetical protein VNI00_014539 [Paramarasmius palmivorus]|uniref:C2H2-type domain-containing protein n=1 Tax=Paramarasmius palmivorus TaxID=297713 RepID=A0AAW0BTJ5_9AGAR
MCASRRKQPLPRTLPCPVKGCQRLFRNPAGLANHRRVHGFEDVELESSSLSDSDFAQPDRDAPMEPDNNADEIQLFGHLEDLDMPPPATGEHAQPSVEANTSIKRNFHEVLTARRCDSSGNFLPPDAPVPDPPSQAHANDWTPWHDGLEFRTANLLYRRMQASAGEIDELMEIITAMTAESVDTDPLFADVKDLYSTIDACSNGAVPWRSFSVKYDGPRTPGKVEPWMDKEYMVYYRDPRQVLHRQLSNPDFMGEIEMVPYQAESTADGKRQYQNFMSGNWAMREADEIAKLPGTEGSMLCATVAGSDKTTVSVATGQNDYYPGYLSNGNLTNNARRSHRGGVSLFMFLAIPKTDRRYQDSAEFRRFRRYLFHQSLRYVFESLRPYMTRPDIVRLADGYYRRVIYSIGPYIGDYPEQVLLACIVQGWCPRCTADHQDLDGPGGPRSREHTMRVREAMPNATQQWDEYGIIDGIMPFTHYFPRADIHKLIAPDILHQLIKGTFKDHLVTWVQEYLETVYTKAEAARIMADIDRRIAAAPHFPGLRRFPEGRGFKQWTGNDSKALMKVYLPAIAGRVPDGIVRTLASFIEVCHLIRRDVISEDTIRAISQQIEVFHRERAIFKDLDIKDTFSLPRQHSLTHYPHLIAEFGSPNGLCSSITESKHISAVKEPWRRSSRNQPLGEMLVINDRMDKLEWAEVDFRSRGMLSGPVSRGLSEEFVAQSDKYAREMAAAVRLLAHNLSADDDDDDGGPLDGRDICGKVTLAKKHVPGLPRDPASLERHLEIKNFQHLLRCFLYEQGLPTETRNEPVDWFSIDEDVLPELDSKTKVWVYPSAVATFSAPSDLCGFGGMKRERIRAVSSWKSGPARHDCIFVAQGPGSLSQGFRGLEVARVLHFISLVHEHKTYACAVVHWFSKVGDSVDPLTGMWIVTPDEEDGERVVDIIPLDSVVRGAHLMGVAGKEWIPNDHSFTDTLDDFNAFYVNKFIDHHAHEIAF